MTPLGDILVLGIGSSGEACARYCAGLPRDVVSSVTVIDSGTDQRREQVAKDLEALGVTVVLSAESLDARFDIAIASPGIPPHAALMKWAHTAATEVVSELEFAFRRSGGPWVAVTGTNGKTTTTALITHLLEAGGVSARAVGNIGTPAISVVAESAPTEVLVAEVSSFQLALTSTFHPRVAVLLNVTPDHLDWHGSVQAYEADKAKVFANLGPDDVAVVDVDDAGSAPYADTLAMSGVAVVRVSRETAYAGGATVSHGHLTLETAGGPVRLLCIDELRIRGPHNVSNALAASAAAHAIGVAPADLMSGLRSFEPIEHRLEPAGDACGAEWFNDSKATNPDAVVKALQSFDGRPIVLLAGGRNKGNEFAALASEARGRVRALVAFGEARDELMSAFADTDIDVHESVSLAAAIQTACELARQGDAVVLSPACASFDEFVNYEERGRFFKDRLSALAGERR